MCSRGMSCSNPASEAMAIYPLLLKATSVRPSPRQLAWQQREFYAFIHFTVNTFTDREWGDGTEDPDIFDPVGFDAAQWVSVIEDAGMTGLILTAKHHDGFCLWPTVSTDHSVRHSRWRDGEGDIVAEVAAACRERGIAFGIYLSPWDRHEPSYGDTPRYNAFFLAQLRELLSGYGDIFCVWFDGACGEGPNGRRQQYDWEAYYALIRELQPEATINVCGPDVRWCGNEAGHCRPSEWSVVPAALQGRETIAESSQQEDDDGQFAARLNSTDDDLGSRDMISRAGDLVWYPAEVNTSIRPGWFYHAEEDDRVKTLDELADVYFGSVGGNACFLLNFSPDRRGLIHENDAARAGELGELLRRTFAIDLAVTATVRTSPVDGSKAPHPPEHLIDGHPDTYWASGQESAVVEISLPSPGTINVAMLQEHIELGQRVERFRLTALIAGDWLTIAEATVIGYKRILRFAPVTTDRVRVEILESRLSPTLSRVSFYYSRDLPR